MSNLSKSDKLIRILIVDDHRLVRKGLRAMLDATDDLSVIGEATNGNEAVAQTLALQPDVILMDLVMPHKDGPSAIREIMKEIPDARIIVLTSFTNDEKVFTAIKAGALGYLLKDTTPQILFQAIRTAYQGNPTFDPAIALKLMQELKQPTASGHNKLTPREKEVLKLVAQGLTNQQIANLLVVSERTVSTHVSTILSKLNLENRIQATLYALRKGLVDLD